MWIFEYLPEVPGFWPFLVIEIFVTTLAIWWFLLDDGIPTHKYTPSKSKHNPLDNWRHR